LIAVFLDDEDRQRVLEPLGEMTDRFTVRGQGQQEVVALLKCR